MSGLRINYQKSEVFVLGVEEEERGSIANQFNCAVGSFPLKYLGIPVSPTKILMEGFNGIVEKVEKRLEGWRSGSLSFGGGRF